MFEDFYGFRNTPFTRDIPENEVYRTEQLEENLGRLQYAAERQLLVVVAGECGVGKTTTIRKFESALDPFRYRLLYVTESKLTPRNFYRALLNQLGHESKYNRGDARLLLHKEIEIMKGVHHLNPVVVMDEAHLLSKEMLEEVRFLLNFKMDSCSPMALVLVGQLELLHRLQNQAYEAIRQRIDLLCKLGCFDRASSEAYMRRHLDYAGLDKDHELFTDLAKDAIFRYSNGLARKINSVCSHSLTYGAQNGKRLIDEHIVNLVIERELDLKL